MQRYRDYKPTTFDQAGLVLDDRQDWIVVPCGRNRDSEVLDESNFAAALAILGGESATCEVHRFGHWACGWFEIIIVAPERETEVKAIADRLADYPLLNEDDHSRREFEAINEAWNSMSLRGRIRLAAEHGASIFSVRRVESPWDLDLDGDWPYSLIQR